MNTHELEALVLLIMPSLMKHDIDVGFCYQKDSYNSAPQLHVYLEGSHKDNFEINSIDGEFIVIEQRGKFENSDLLEVLIGIPFRFPFGKQHEPWLDI